MPPQCDKEKAFFQNQLEKGFCNRFNKAANDLTHSLFQAVGRFSNVANPSSSAGSS
ncbi:hypothetical protein GGR96_001797 [Thalassospira tepidiphila]|uniref:Uncharacterized protein n=1 Tax=Thalassospira tepidiphila TaxID=393657 RepID=A0ABX0WZB8_9PROT|nr:hypothetical protein [Thalassospira tepidiphila]